MWQGGFEDEQSKEKKAGERPETKAHGSGFDTGKGDRIFRFSLRSLQAYEKGESTPSLAKAVKMARLYGCKVDDLTERKEDEEE